MKKSLVIIAARGIGDLIYHLPLLRSLYESYKEKLIIISNKVNHSKEIYKYEKEKDRKGNDITSGIKQRGRQRNIRGMGI